MTSGNRFPPRLLTIAALLSALPALAATDVEALIARLARPAPARVAFTEIRISSLLKAPLVVSGELSYAGPTSLERRVLEPYREHTTIRGESVRVEREGAPPRTFALRRAPELRGILGSFSALLAGDAETIEREFETDLTQEGDRWTLALEPREARLKRRLKQIVIEGERDTPRCFTLHDAGGGASVMLLGAAADVDLGSNVTLETLDGLCAAEEKER